jgi:DUF3048 family protein
MRRSTLAVFVVASSLLAAACGGGSKTAATTAATDAPTTAAPTSTTTTSTTLGTTTSTVATTTTYIGAGLDPLTGRPDAEASVLTRPALVVKINNHPLAWPQTGINQADIVFEELVEGISRFAVVFHSQDSSPVGSIRSARTGDINIMALLGRPLLAWSGGNPGVVSAVKKANLVDVGYSFHSVDGGYFRSTDRKAPHNLFADTVKLFTLAKPDQGPPPHVFTFRAAADSLPATAKPVTGVKVSFEGIQAQFVWDAVSSTWQRSQALVGGAQKPHLDSKGAQVAPQNVVVMFCQYRPSPADPKSPEAQTTGTGDVWVFTGGKVIEGTWSRPTVKDPLTLADASGAPITLTPGQTWVELPKSGKGVQIPAGTDPTTVKFP